MRVSLSRTNSELDSATDLIWIGCNDTVSSIKWSPYRASDPEVSSLITLLRVGVILLIKEQPIKNANRLIL